MRCVLQLFFLLLLLALFLPTMVHAQAHDIQVPDTAVYNPMYARELVEYLPDSTYDRWWHEIAECEGLKLPDFYVLVKWVQINYAWFILPKSPPPPGQVTLGHSFLEEWQVYIAIPYRWNAAIIKHEMLHFLLWWNHIATGGHPPRYFERCGIHTSYHGEP